MRNTRSSQAMMTYILQLDVLSRYLSILLFVLSAVLVIPSIFLSALYQSERSSLIAYPKCFVFCFISFVCSIYLS